LNRSLALFPAEFAGWRMISQAALDERTLDKLKPTDYLSRLYQSANGDKVQLYVGYHAGGKESGEIHSPKHCLPGSGWLEESRRIVRLDEAGAGMNVVEAVYRKGERRELFLYWFQLREQAITSEYSLKAVQIINSLRFGRRDAAFIRVALPVATHPKQAAGIGERFVRDLYPLLKGFLPV
jgi:EpsI family protein